MARAGVMEGVDGISVCKGSNVITHQTHVFD